MTCVCVHCFQLSTTNDSLLRYSGNSRNNNLCVWLQYFYNEYQKLAM